KNILGTPKAEVITAQVLARAARQSTAAKPERPWHETILKTIATPPAGLADSKLVQPERSVHPESLIVPMALASYPDPKINVSSPVLSTPLDRVLAPESPRRSPAPRDHTMTVTQPVIFNRWLEAPDPRAARLRIPSTMAEPEKAARRPPEP